MWQALVVDDNQMNCDLLVDTLEGKAQCVTVNNGEDALVRYNQSIEAKKPFDFILLDIAMPGLDGLDVLKAIRSKETVRNLPLGFGIPILMVTAYKEPFLEAFNHGCDDYILKPIDPEKLINKITEKLAAKG